MSIHFIGAVRAQSNGVFAVFGWFWHRKGSDDGSRLSCIHCGPVVLNWNLQFLVEFQ